MSFKNTVFFKHYVAACILGLFSVMGILIARSYLPPFIPLFYGKPAGIEELAPRDFLFIIPIISIIISLLNFTISKFIKDDFVKKVLATGSSIVSVITTIAVTKIILLIGFF